MRLWSSLGLCWPILKLCWPNLGLCWPIFGLCWPIVELCWPIFKPMLAHLGAMLAQLGRAVYERCGPCCEAGGRFLTVCPQQGIQSEQTVVPPWTGMVCQPLIKTRRYYLWIKTRKKVRIPECVTVSSRGVLGQGCWLALVFMIGWRVRSPDSVALFTEWALELPTRSAAYCQ